MTETVTADPTLALWLGFLGTVIVALLGLLGVLANRTRQHARAGAADAKIAREEVRNNHYDPDGKPINMREENDRRHAEMMASFRAQEAVQRGMQRDIGRLADVDRDNHGDIAQLRKELSEHITWSKGEAEKLRDLEDTQPQRTKE